jgi:uncharacterized protein YceK
MVWGGGQNRAETDAVLLKRCRTSELLLEEEARLAGGGRHGRRDRLGRWLGFCGARNDSHSRDAVTQIDGRRWRLIYRRAARSSEKMGVGKGGGRAVWVWGRRTKRWLTGRAAALPLPVSLLSATLLLLAPWPWDIVFIVTMVNLEQDCDVNLDFGVIS